MTLSVVNVEDNDQPNQAPPTNDTITTGMPKTPLTRAGMLQPLRRPSIKVPIKQQPHKTTAVEGGNSSSREPPSLSAGRKNVPKLHRQLSQVASRVVDGSPLPPVSPEEQIKVQRYERMMDRFQLRRVPLGRSRSSTSATTATSHREGARTESGSRPASRRNSIDTRSDAPPGSARRLSGSIHAGAPGDEVPEAPEVSRRPSLQSLLSSTAAKASFISVEDAEAMVLTPFAQTGLVTRLRLSVVVAAFAAQLTYMPYGIAYYTENHPTTIHLDAAVDASLLLNIVVACNTVVPNSRDQLVTSRRAIWRHYRHHGLFLDLLAFELLLLFVDSRSWLRWALRVVQLLLQLASVHRHLSVFHAAWAKEAIRTDKSIIAWILYSRYSHLVRIGGIVLMITLMAHYFACVWSWLLLEVDPDFLSTNDPLSIHLRSIYEALQLLQGQGVDTTTRAQDIFGSVAVLLGSIALAVVFGHVAILVSNFSANQTSYQRKMESVFAIMGKLQLPHPIRERVHQYYEYLHAEYESLDGEIVKFAKELSHTLQLEVVLFKYMDVVMHVPHWRECSPDFQKQLVLNVQVRVYLPDDFIMRRGEVGAECYIINRGTCKLHEYPSGNYEPPTLAMIPGEEEPQTARYNRRSSKSSLPPQTTPRKPTGKAAVRPSRYSVQEGAVSDFDCIENGPYSRITVLKRGQAIGDMALLANYERSSDLRAVTYVEMCVIEREPFQRILTRYPRDRELVIGSIVHHMMLHLAADRIPCMLMKMVHEVAPKATVTTGIQMVTKAMNPRENDPTIVFGMTEQLSARLREVAAVEGDDDSDSSSESEPPSPQKVALEAEEDLVAKAKATADMEPRRRSIPKAAPPPVPAIESDPDLIRLLHDIQERLIRIENHQQQCEQICSSPSRPTSANATEGRKREHPVEIPALETDLPCRKSIRRPRRGFIRRHSMEADAEPAHSRHDASSSATIDTPKLPPFENDDPTAATQSTSPEGSSKGLLRELVGSLWHRSSEAVPAETPSLTPWTDQLFQSKRRATLHDAAARKRRSSLRRSLST